MRQFHHGNDDRAKCFIMDPNMKQLQEALVDIETDAEQLLLARQQIVENDRMRNANREALTALRKRARTTKTSVPSPFEIIMKEMEGTSGKQLVKEICPTCGNHDPKEHTWLTFPRSDIFARVPFHVAHTVLDKDQERLGYDTKKLQSFVKEKSFVISEKGALADKISPGIVKSLVSLTDKPRVLVSGGSRGLVEPPVLEGFRRGEPLVGVEGEQADEELTPGFRKLIEEVEAVQLPRRADLISPVSDLERDSIDCVAFTAHPPFEWLRHAQGNSIDPRTGMDDACSPRLSFSLLLYLLFACM
ncbi:hypothetical protein ACQ4PT_037524 [Festuca glaucescens]